MVESALSKVHGKAAILAVGTELTSGQITNRNAAWLSAKLVGLGVEVILHEAVADDRKRIREALEHCAEQSQLLFVTGGLGPTTDDFTREIIADWLGQPLEFQESAWQQIVSRLTGFGIPVAESNRQQCYFPVGSRIIPNSEGTAAGFTAAFPNSDDRRVWILPGPPREVAAVWNAGIESQIREMVPDLKALELLTWQCMGKSEAELGELTEATLVGSGLQTGYRAHRPFVEVKVWCPSHLLQEKMPWISKLEKAIAPWTVASGEDDLARGFLSALRRFERIRVYDSASGGFLAERLTSLLRDEQYSELKKKLLLISQWENASSPEEWVAQVFEESRNEKELVLALGGFSSDGKAALGFREKEHRHQEVFVLPYRNPALLNRMRPYAVELAFKRWAELLISSP